MTEKTFTWDEPSAVLQKAATMSGLDALRAMRDGELPGPPIAALMSMGITEVEPGRVTFTSEPGEEHYNPIGVVHGGLACTLLDTVVGCAAHTMLAAGVGYTSIDLNVSYLRPITLSTGTITAVGEVVKAGRRVIFAKGTIFDADGRELATATSSLLVMESSASRG